MVEVKNKIHIVYGTENSGMADYLMRVIFNDFLANDIEACHFYFKRHIIETDKYTIKFVPIKTIHDYIPGRVADKAFGFSEEVTIILTKDHKPNKPGETLYDYLSELEGKEIKHYD